MARGVPAVAVRGVKAVAAGVLAWHGSAQAHGQPFDAWMPAFEPEPWLLWALGLAAVLYAVGALRLWRHAGPGRGLGYGQAASYALGWLTLVLALASPLDALGAHLFSAHMVQHELLMIVCAPLLVAGRPLAAWAWALPRPWLRGLRGVGAVPGLGLAWHVLTRPMVAWALHGLAVWLWHVPALFDAALRSQAVHELQHFSFFASALLFWWVALAPRAAGIGYLFTTMVHTGALGALITLAPTVWYLGYGDAPAQLGMDPLEDQQIGGLIMWVPAAFAYLLAGLVSLGRWLNRSPA